MNKESNAEGISIEKLASDLAWACSKIRMLNEKLDRTKHEMHEKDEQIKVLTEETKLLRASLAETNENLDNLVEKFNRHIKLRTYDQMTIREIDYHFGKPPCAHHDYEQQFEEVKRRRRLEAERKEADRRMDYWDKRFSSNWLI